MPPRIQPVEDPDAEQSALLAKTLAGPDGQPLNIFRILVHRPELMKRVNALGGYFMAHGGIQVREGARHPSDCRTRAVGVRDRAASLDRGMRRAVAGGDRRGSRSGVDLRLGGE